MSTMTTGTVATTSAAGEASPRTQKNGSWIDAARSAEGRGLGRLPLLLLVSAQFLVMLDSSVVNVALASIQGDLALSRTGTAWVVNVYFLTFGGFLLLAGRAADVVGRRRMFMLGLALLTIATTAAGLAHHQSVLLAARAVQGMGAAAVSSAALSILLIRFPGSARAKAMAAWGAASTLGGATGVLAGGLMTAAFGWSWVFLLTVPLSVGAFAAAPHVLDRLAPTGPRRPLDSWGAATIIAAALAIIYGAISIADHGATAWQTVTGLGAGVALLGVFVLIERRSPDGLLPLDLFRSRSVSIGVILGLLGGGARASTFVLVALYLQQSLAMQPSAAGLAMVPTSVTGFIVSLVLLPRLLRAHGSARTLTTGLALLAAAHLWLARVPNEAGYALDVLPGLLLAAAGVALSFTPTTMVIASGVPAHSTGMATGLANASSQIGAALGISIITVISASTTGASGAVGAGTGFHAAFTTAAVLAATAGILGGTLIPRTPPGLAKAADPRT